VSLSLPPSPALAGDAQGLDAGDFRQINRSGFGDGLNSYAHSMAWFEGRLYVGTTRGVLQVHKVNVPVPNMKPWPTDSKPDVYDYDRRAEIWCYDPTALGGLGEWTRVYQSALVPGRNKRDVARYIGFRGMTVFKGADDPKPCLYVSTWSPSMAPEPPDILRSEDGRSFHSAQRPPFGEEVRSFRTLQQFGGRVHTTPTSTSVVVGGVRRGQDSVGSDSTIYCTDNIAGGKWTAANQEGFGERANVTVFEMCEFKGRLYAGTVNPRGFQLWRTEAADKPPYTWKRVLNRGAWRGPHNEAIASLYVFKGALYVGTGVANGGFHRQFRIGPAAAEIIRVYEDDSWELLMGLPRDTPDGMKTPLSGYSAGFDNIFNGYIWRMCEHAGWLYVGSFSWANALPYVPMQIWPEDVLQLMRRWGLDRLNREMGGFDLWRTKDGIRWENVTRSGFENCYNWGIRNFASTPHGLFIGTANPYGPKIAIQREGKWRYVHNPRGGCEVFLGHRPGEE
jgi:hypothetical protein